MKCRKSTHHRSFRPLAVILLGALLALPLAADDNPYTKADETWVTVSGTVESVTADSFLLDYGDGLITVEMDDGDRDADGYKLVKGDKVNVSGRIDDDFYEKTTIEAGSVYVEKLGTTFYASAVDDEEFHVDVYSPVVISKITVRGVVTEVSAEEFVLDTGTRKLTVEVEEMPYNPLDDEGYQKIKVGDRVSVTGEMDTDLFEGKELVAEFIVNHFRA